MDHDGPRMCGEQSRKIKAASLLHVCTNVYRRQSIKSVFSHSAATEWFAPLKTPPGRCQSRRKTQQLSGFVPLASTEQIFSCHWGPTFFFLLKSGLVRRVHPRCIVRARPFTPSTSASPRSWHAKKASEAGGEKEQRDTANIWKQDWEVTSTLQRLFRGGKKKVG